VSERPPSPTNPTDTSLRSVVDDLASQGFDGQFRTHPNGQVECLSCHGRAPASRYRADEVTRLEGVSDPDDMVMVAPVRCHACGTRGTLVLGYGPEASAEDSDVLLALERSPQESTDESDIAGPTPGVS
jgi:hypothetical protein